MSEVDPNRPIFAEQKLGSVEIMDHAYALALTGRFNAALELSGQDSQVILLAASQLGIDLPSGHRAFMISAADAAKNLTKRAAMVDLQIAEAALNGSRSRGDTARSMGAAATKGLTSLIEVPLAVAGAASDKVGIPVLGKVLDVASDVVAMPATAVNYTKMRGRHKLIAAAHRRVSRVYGQSCNNAPALRPWLLAELLSRLSKYPETEGSQLVLVDDFLDASERLAVRAVGGPEVKRKDGSIIPRPGHEIVRLSVDLADGVLIKDAIGNFKASVAAARQERKKAYAKHFGEPKSSLPSFEVWENFTLSAAKYSADSGKPVAQLIEGLPLDVQEEDLSPDELELIASRVCIAIERLQLKHEPERQEFNRLLQWTLVLHKDKLAELVSSNAEKISANTAAAPVVLLANSMLTRSDIWGQNVLGQDEGRIDHAISQAAFSWYGQIKQIEAIRHTPTHAAIRRGYLYRTASPYPPPQFAPALTMLRIDALLSGLPKSGPKRDRILVALNPEARADIELAEATKPAKTSNVGGYANINPVKAAKEWVRTLRAIGAVLRGDAKQT